ncbi:MAG: FMN-binding protein [Spirochaetia bacterium]
MTKKKKRLFIILGITAGVIIVLVVVMAIMINKADANMQKLMALTIEDVNLKDVTDGTYRGKYSGFPLVVVVDVTVKDHRITDVDLVKHQHGQGADAEVLPERIEEAQTLKVDMVSGATYSSKAILKAAERALLLGK